MSQTFCSRPINTLAVPVRRCDRLRMRSLLHASQLHIHRYLVAGHENLRGTHRCSHVHIRRFQRAEAQQRGSGVHVISNWNGTMELPKYDFGDKVLQEGSFGGDVLELQRFLNAQGYFHRLKETPDGYTGYFGDLTKEALKAWQEDCHLAADGQFGQSCRQAVARCQAEVQQQHMNQQQGVEVKPSVPGRSMNPIQAAGLAFLLGGVVMFAYQLWAWWRHKQQANAAQRADEVLQDDREEQDAMWASDGQSQSSSASFSYAPHPAAPRTYGRGHASSASAPGPQVRPPSPRYPLVRPISPNASQTPTSSGEDPSGPAVSLDGYPRYTPQWGVGLPEKKKSVPPTQIRREPSERAKAVMARPGSPPYPKTAGGGPKANGSTLRGVPPERSSNRNKAAVARPRVPPQARPRSPNPTAMPESLTKPPPLKPTLDPSAKSWIQIAVSQRGPSRNGRVGQGAHSHPHAQTPPGSHGSGVAQILSVEEERQLGMHRNGQNGSSSTAAGNGSSGVSGNGNEEGHASNGGSTKTGVSLFGSFKAPVKQQ